jgi:hypothetical protein
MKFLHFFLFCGSFFFALLDPDPDPATQINADPCGSGSAILPTTDAVAAATHHLTAKQQQLKSRPPFGYYADGKEQWPTGLIISV